MSGQNNASETLGQHPKSHEGNNTGCSQIEDTTRGRQVELLNGDGYFTPNDVEDFFEIKTDI